MEVWCSLEAAGAADGSENDAAGGGCAKWGHSH